MTRWWATKKLDEDGLVFSPFGDEVSQENVKFLVEAGNINIATTGFHLKKLQTWLKRTNYHAAYILAKIPWSIHEFSAQVCHILSFFTSPI